ncbi:MAG: hypothetical protein CSB34_00430 [Desulfobulbus propionicus]|nr:MAG: hypothetical protein CSB34_00430 [Desulfobulbus propionicus]
MQNSNVQPRPFSLLPLYEQEHLQHVTGGVLRPGGTALTAELIALADLPPKAVMLDVGCGAGHTLQLMHENSRFSPIGIDLSLTMLAKSNIQAPGVPKGVATATALPFTACSYDGVMAECSLSLTESISASLEEMYRVLKPGGKLLLSDIYRKRGHQESPAGNMHSCLNTFLSLEEIKKAVTKTGFSLRYLQDCTSLLKQLAGQLIFSYGSMEQFWQLIMDEETARQTCSRLAKVSLGYYALVAEKRTHNG